MDTKIKKPLVNKVMILRPVERIGSWPQILNPDSAGNILWPGAHYHLKGIPYDVNKRKFLEPLTKEEREGIEVEEHGFKSGDLIANVDGGVISLNRKDQKKSWWTRKSIVLQGNPIKLRLEDVHDFLTYKFLLVQGIVAKDEESIVPKTHMYYFEEEGAQEVKEGKRATQAANVFTEIVKIQNNPDKLTQMLKLWEYKKSGSFDKKKFEGKGTDVLFGMVAVLANDDPKEFNKFLNDEKYEKKVEILGLIESGVIQYGRKEGRRIFEAVGYTWKTVDEIIEFLDNPKNQAIEMQLHALKEERSK